MVAILEEHIMENAWKIMAFVGSGYLAIGAAAGFPIGFYAAVMLMGR